MGDVGVLFVIAFSCATHVPQNLLNYYTNVDMHIFLFVIANSFSPF